MILARALRWTVTFVALVVLSAPMAGCGSSITAPASAPFSQTDLRVGTGATATSGSSLTANYTGWLYDASQPEQKGTQFDSSIGKAPITFTLGTSQVIAGWDQGLLGMQAGGLRRLVIPPSLGYGSSRFGNIPPNSTLVFEIDLISVQ